jgi:protein transport protein SEC24
MLNSENIREDGIYLLENGEDGLIYVGNIGKPGHPGTSFWCLFGGCITCPGKSTCYSIVCLEPNSLLISPVVLNMHHISLFVLMDLRYELSRKVNEVVNEIRRQRCSYLR